MIYTKQSLFDEGMRKIQGRTIHIDSCYLLAHQEDDTADFIQKQLNEAKYRKNKRKEVVRVSIVALGECLMRCLEDPKYKIDKIFEWLDKLEVDTPAPDEEIIDVARDLIVRSKHYLKPCDALIVATALCDRSAYILLTINQPIIGLSLIHI